MVTEIDLADRRTATDPSLGEDARRFLTALAVSLNDDKWYAIDHIKVLGSKHRIQLATDSEHRNSIGNSYVKSLANLGYVLVGYGNHYTDDDAVDSITFHRADASIFPDQTPMSLDDPHTFIYTDPRDRLNEIDVVPVEL